MPGISIAMERYATAIIWVKGSASETDINMGKLNELERLFESMSGE